MCPYLVVKCYVHCVSRGDMKSNISAKYVSLFDGKMLCPNLTVGLNVKASSNVTTWSRLKKLAPRTV